MTDKKKEYPELNTQIPEPKWSFMNQIKEWGTSISESLINMQRENESEVFQVLNIKRKFETLEPDEKKYFDNYVNTFRVEVLSGLVTFPMCYLAFRYRQEMKKTIKDVPKVNKYLKLLFLFGIPSVNIFLFAIYRRYFYISSYEAPLKLKYSKEIRQFKIKPPPETKRR